MLRIRLLIGLTIGFLAASATYADNLGYISCSSHPEQTPVLAKARETRETVATLACDERFTVILYGFIFSRIQTSAGKIGYVYSNLISVGAPAASGQQAPAPSSPARTLPPSTTPVSAAPASPTASTGNIRGTTISGTMPNPASSPTPSTAPTTVNIAQHQPATPQPTSVQPAAHISPAPTSSVPAASAQVSSSSASTTPLVTSASDQPNPAVAQPQPSSAQPVSTSAPSASVSPTPASNAKPAAPAVTGTLPPAPTILVESHSTTTDSVPAERPVPVTSAPASSVPAASVVTASTVSDAAPAAQPAPTSAEPQPEPAQPQPAAPAIRPARTLDSWEKPNPGVRRTPLIELYGGYAFARLSNGAGSYSNLQGALGSFGWNANSWLQIVADSSYNIITATGTKTILYGNHYGPRLFFRRRNRFHVIPFAEALAGGSRADTTVSGTTTSVNTFSFKAGGGFDIKPTRYLAIRLINVDYYRTSFGFGTHLHENNYWASAGIILRLFGGSE